MATYYIAGHVAGEPIDDDDDVVEDRTYEAFERRYAGDHSWEGLKEDERGRLRRVDPTAELRARRQRTQSAAQSARVRRGMIRYVLLVGFCGFVVFVSCGFGFACALCVCQLCNPHRLDR